MTYSSVGSAESYRRTIGISRAVDETDFDCGTFLKVTLLCLSLCDADFAMQGSGKFINDAAFYLRYHGIAILGPDLMLLAVELLLDHC